MQPKVRIRSQGQTPEAKARARVIELSQGPEPELGDQGSGIRNRTEQNRDKAGKQTVSTVAASKELTQLYRQHPVPLSGLNNAVRLNQWGWALLQLGLQSARDKVPLANQHTNY